MDSVVQSTADAEADLATVARAQAAAHRTATAVWFPLLPGGIATLASPGAVDVIGGAAPEAWYWGTAGPAIGLACAVFYGTRAVQMPGRVARGSVLVAALMVGSAMLLGALLSDDARRAAPVFVVAAGLGAFAVLYRSALVAAVAAAGLAQAIVLASTEADRAHDAAALAFGALACGAAIFGMLALERDGRSRL